MDISIQEVRDYTWILIKFLLSLFFNLKHPFNSMKILIQPYEKKLKTRRMLRLWYARHILLKRSQYLSRSILSLTWKQESTAFQDMMMTRTYLRGRICQYFPILDKFYKKNIVKEIYLTKIKFKHTYNYMLFNCNKLKSLFDKHNINMLLSSNNFDILLNLPRGIIFF